MENTQEAIILAISSTMAAQDNTSRFMFEEDETTESIILDMDEELSEIPKYPRFTLGFTAACAFIIAVLGSFSNFLTIVALPMTKKLRTTATAFVVNLAVVELLFCLFILPMSGAQYLYLQKHGESLLRDNDCKFFVATRYTLTQVELQTILAIALTRALAVAVPRFYALLNRTSVIGGYIAFIWIYSFLLKLPPAIGLFGKYGFNRKTMECDVTEGHPLARLILIIVEAVIPVILIIVLYIFVFIMVVRRAVLRRRKFSNVLQPQVKRSSYRVQRATMRNNSRVAPPPTSTTSASSSSAGNCQRKGSNSSFRSLKRMMTDTNLRARFLHAARHLNEQCTHQTSNVSQKLATNRRDMRVARTIFIIFVFVLVCSVPVMMVHILDKEVLYPNRFLLLHVLYWTQYCLNMVVYVLMNRQYRDAYVDCLARVFPHFKKHQGRRFFWERPSVSSKPQPNNNSFNKGPRKDSAGALAESVSSEPDPAAGGAANHGISKAGRLSDIPEGHSSSAANDSVFSDPRKEKNSLDAIEDSKMIKEDVEKEVESEPEEDTNLMDKERWVTTNGSAGETISNDEAKV